MANPNPLLEAALSYAERGWRVVPLQNLTPEGKCTCQQWRDKQGAGDCPTPAKHPRFKGFAERASKDPDQIRKWWKQWPKANVGIITGKESGIWALDTDPRNGGDESRRVLVYKNARLPYTTTARTGGGGTHEYFQWPADFDLPSAIFLEDGLDVVGEGHVLVAPPSLHPNGRVYQWEEELDPLELLPQPTPDWLLALLRSRMQPAQPAAQAGANERRGDYRPSDIGPILSGCSWMRHCSDDAATLTEPEWYAQLSIVGRCINGEELAHELSRPYPGYSATDTAKKLQHAITAAGPATCSKIRHSLGGARHCEQCPSWGKIKSPIVLGIERQQRIDAPWPPETDAAPPAAPSDDDAPLPSDADAPAPADDVNPEDAARSFDQAKDAVERAIATNEPTAALDLLDMLSRLDDEQLAWLKARLRTHFGKRLSMKDFAAGIKSARIKRRNSSREDHKKRGAANWRSLLLYNNNGSPKAHLANAITALRHAPEWQGLLVYDIFAEQVMMTGKGPINGGDGHWTDLHDLHVADWLQQQGIDVSKEVAGQAVQVVSHDRTIHPPRDYVLGLKWDGTPRIAMWLQTYLGVKPRESDPIVDAAYEGKAKPTPYIEAVAEKWLVSAIARIFHQPESKADCALVLEGEQGIKKSTALEVLGYPWFTDQLSGMDTKDASIETHGVWIIEIGELGSMSKAQVENVKDFMSRKTERFRPPYGARLVRIPRQCVFAGTTNRQDWNRDDTGARRFWPVWCTKIDLESLRRDRDQLWAEAFERYQEGCTWWLDVPETIREAEEEQQERYRLDPWHNQVANFIAFREEVTVDEILGGDCIGVAMDRWSQADQNRIASILQLCGWRKFRPRRGSKRVNVYKPYTIEARLSNATQQPLGIIPKL